VGIVGMEVVHIALSKGKSGLVGRYHRRFMPRLTTDCLFLVAASEGWDDSSLFLLCIPPSLELVFVITAGIVVSAPKDDL
jgi:hypothetical protein